MSKNSTFSAFLKYGIGEILLVVLGILIAIQINNWNEKRKDIHTVNGIILELQNELASDIQEVSRLIRFADLRVKKAEKVLASEIEISEYSSPNKYELFKLGTETYPLVVTNLAFNKLSKFKGHIPKEYKELMTDMNELYLEEKRYLDELYERLQEYTLNNYNQMFSKYEWMVEYEKYNTTPDMLDYFEKNPFYKNHIKRYYDLLSVYGQKNARRFKSKAAILYYDIEEFTHSGNTPEMISTFAPSKDPSSLKEYVGEYKYTKGEHTSKVYQEKGRLFYNDELIVQKTKDTFEFTIENEYNLYFTKNEQQEILGANIVFRDSIYSYNKSK